MKVSPFTAVPRNGEFSPEIIFEDCHPHRLLNGLLGAVYDQGAAKAKGWLFGSVHGEYDPVGNRYRLHIHGMASDEMIGKVDKIRQLPNYATKRFSLDGQPSPVFRRLRIERQPITNLPVAITYLLQSFWPSRALIIDDTGKRVRARAKQRIAEPYHSQVLLWLDQFELDDLIVMIGLRVTKDGLKQTKRSS